MANATPFVKAETFTRRYIQCPICKGDGKDFYVDHLIKDAKPGKPYSAGPWRCNSCKESFLFKVYMDGNVEVAQSDTHMHRSRSPGFVLLKACNSDENPIYLVLSSDYADEDFVEEKKERGSSHLPYWFDEHTCPTNWTRDIVSFIHDGDDDPHGVFQFVSVLSHKDAIDYALSHPDSYDAAELKALGDDPSKITDFFDNCFMDLFYDALNESSDIDGEVIEAETVKLLN